MDLNIRQAILHNIQQNTEDQLEATIEDAIQDGQEKLLPGLGFLFELIWNESDEADRLDMITALKKGIQQTNSP